MSRIRCSMVCEVGKYSICSDPIPRTSQHQSRHYVCCAALPMSLASFVYDPNLSSTRCCRLKILPAYLSRHVAFNVGNHGSAKNHFVNFTTCTCPPRECHAFVPSSFRLVAVFDVIICITQMVIVS